MSTTSNSDEPSEHRPSLQDAYDEEVRKNDGIRVTVGDWSIQGSSYYVVVIVAILVIAYLVRGGYPYAGPGIFIVLLVALANPNFRLNGNKTPERRPADKSP